jgi:hypothetical protein
VTVSPMHLDIADSFVRGEVDTWNASFTSSSSGSIPQVQIHPGVEQHTLDPLQVLGGGSFGITPCPSRVSTLLSQQEGSTSAAFLSTAKEDDQQVVTGGASPTFVSVSSGTMPLLGSSTRLSPREWEGTILDFGITVTDIS